MQGSVYYALKEILKIASMFIQKRDIRVEVEIKQILHNYPVLSFDKRRLQQVLYNVMTNAIKFTRKGSIFIQARVGPDLDVDDHDHLLLTVSVTD